MTEEPTEPKIYPTYLDKYTELHAETDEEYNAFKVKIMQLFSANTKEHKGQGETWQLIATFVQQKVKMLTLKDSGHMYYYNKERGIWILDSGKESKSTLVDLICYKLMPGISKNARTLVIDNVKLLRTKPDNIFNINPYLIVLKNCVFDLQTFTTHDFSSDYYLTNQLPIIYDPQATCPNIDAYLASLVHSEQLNILEEMIGYCLYPAYPIKRAFLLNGAWNSGKTTLGEFLTKFLGKENVSSVSIFDFSTDANKRAEMLHKYVNFSTEETTEGIKSAKYFLSFTGNDEIDFKILYLNVIYAKSYAKIIQASNNIPVFLHGHTAVWNRIITIDFIGSFIEKEGYLDDKTTDQEFSGLFNKSVTALKNLLERGHFNEDSKEKRTERVLKESNPIEHLFTKIYVKCDLENARIILNDVLAEYNKLRPNEGTMTTNKLIRQIRDYFRGEIIKTQQVHTPDGYRTALFGFLPIIDVSNVNVDPGVDIQELERELEELEKRREN